MPGTERRNSSSSEDASVPLPRQDGTELIPTRTTKTGAPKPAANPLQFIKVGPCDLYKAAQEQIKKVEEIKKVEKTVKDESPDWQSNLDNWKCSRRKRQEHIIDRVVEVKKLELEEHERNRRRGKTLTEMMEERTQKGIGPRKSSLLAYPADDPDDLTDLGISTCANSNDDDSGFLPDNSEIESQTKITDDNDNKTQYTNKNGTNGNGHASSPENEEYTYERAIQGYKTYAEKNVKAISRQRVSPPKKETGVRIGEKLNELEQVRLRSNSVTDVNLPKVDIHKRRSLFEVVVSADTMSPSAERVARDLGSTKIVKERLSSLERNVEPSVKSPIRPQEEVSVTIKDRLSSLEKQKIENTPSRRLSSEEISHALSIKDRLSSLEKHQQGLKESGSSSDEDFGQKLLLSPTMSDREVSSPLVSLVNDEGFDANLVKGDRETNSKNLVKGSNQDCSGDSLEVGTGDFEGPLNDNTLGREVDEQSSTENAASNKEKDSMKIEEDCSEIGTDSITEPVEEKSKSLEKEHNVLFDSSVSDESENKTITAVTDLAESLLDGAETLTTLENVTIISDDSGPIIVENTTTETVVKNENVPKKETPSRLPLKVSTTKARRSVIKKPQIRVRKLTPILTAPSVQVLSPVKSPSDLEIISEDFPLHPVVLDDLGSIEEDTSEVPVASPRHIVKSSTSVKGAETSESGIDMEESSLYTDENIDEVLAEDDVDESECPPMVTDEQTLINFDEERMDDVTMLEEERRPKEPVVLYDDDRIRFEEESRRHDAITRFDELISNDVDNKVKEASTPETNVLKIENSNKKNEDLFAIDSSFEKPIPVVDDLLCFEEEKSPLKEVSSVSSVIISEKVPIVESTTQIMPVQEPVLYENIIIANEMSQLGLSSGEIVSFPLSPLSCAEPPKEKPPPPPVDLSDEEAPELPPKKTSLRRIDSTKRIKKEIRKKRSDFLGIEGSNDDSLLDPEVDVAPPPDMMTLLQEERRLDQQLYRQSIASETDSTEGGDRGNAVDRLDKALYLDQSLYRQSICSETDSNHETAESRDSGVELDRGHVDDLCWPKQSVSPDALSHPHSRQNSEPYGNASVTSEEDEIMKKEREIIEELEKEEKWRYGKTLSSSQPNEIGEKLTEKLRELENEKLQLEWERAEEEGRRMADEERLQAKEVHLRQQEKTANINKIATDSQENLRSERERLEKEQLELARAQQQLMAQKRRSEPPRQGPMSTNLRYSMPDLQGDVRTPTSPNKPPSAWTRVPSADNLLAPQQQQMSRTTLQALAAAPRSRLVAGEAWMQPKRKQDAPKSSYNYQHWLIQEAEHRRITEQQQRVNQSRRSLPNQPKRSPTRSNPTVPSRPHSGQFPAGHAAVPHYPPSSTIPYSPPSGTPYSPTNAAPYSPPSGSPYSPPQTNHTRATSNPHQSPPHAVANHSHSHSVGHPSHHTVGLPPSPHVPHSHPNQNKPLPDSVIQTLTQRVQNKASPRRRLDERPPPGKQPLIDPTHLNGEQERMLSVSGKKKCSHCSEELGRGAAMVIESLRLFYHIDCFKCCVCHTQLGDGLMGTDVRVRNNKLHCHNCYSSDDGENYFGFIAKKFAVNEEHDSYSLADSLQSQLHCCCCCYKQHQAPPWFLEFIRHYEETENLRMIQIRKMHLDRIEIEIRKYELLKAVLHSKKDSSS